MGQKWYCKVMGSEYGPVSSKELRKMVQSNQIAPDDHIRKDGSETWIFASRVKGLFSVVANDDLSPPPVPAHDLESVLKSKVAQNKSTGSNKSKRRAKTVQGPSNYTKQHLMVGEKIVYASQVHPVLFAPALLFAILATMGLILFLTPPANFVSDAGFFLLVLFGTASICFGLDAIIIFMTTECVLTNKRIILKKGGLIKLDSSELLLRKVESIKIHQGLIGQIFHCGTVTVIGTGGSKSSFVGIADPFVFRKHVQHTVEEIEDR